jgi:hypothetical protein
MATVIDVEIYFAANICAIKRGNVKQMDEHV